MPASVSPTVLFHRRLHPSPPACIHRPALHTRCLIPTAAARHLRQCHLSPSSLPYPAHSRVRPLPLASAPATRFPPPSAFILRLYTLPVQPNPGLVKPTGRARPDRARFCRAPVGPLPCSRCPLPVIVARRVFPSPACRLHHARPGPAHRMLHLLPATLHVLACTKLTGSPLPAARSIALTRIERISPSPTRRPNFPLAPLPAGFLHAAVTRQQPFVARFTPSPSRCSPAAARCFLLPLLTVCSLPRRLSTAKQPAHNATTSRMRLPPADRRLLDCLQSLARRPTARWWQSANAQRSPRARCPPHVACKMTERERSLHVQQCPALLLHGHVLNIRACRSSPAAPRYPMLASAVPACCPLPIAHRTSLLASPLVVWHSVRYTYVTRALRTLHPHLRRAHNTCSLTIARVAQDPAPAPCYPSLISHVAQ
ncbi:hypothetical protein GGX14DRAFT_569639 [Mycena pura]|uniref:Uncharacterized protein n=1 Tax=Mycena pura TaxID=153505 RepID=A0AAD6VA10_9AGAR|nr:hypothetical protein GGX14DRAFT_569639 [Mycena pura]